MTIEMKKVWFVDGQIIEQEIPESDIYKRPWNIDGCKEYAKQLRDKTRANTAEHAAEAIEFLLAECDALHKEVLRLVNKAVEAEREACAKVCDVLAYHPEFASNKTNKDAPLGALKEKNT